MIESSDAIMDLSFFFNLKLALPFQAHAQCNPGKALGLARKSRAYLIATEAQRQRKQRLERREGSQRPFGWADLEWKEHRLIKWPVGIDIYFDCKIFMYLTWLHVVCGCFCRSWALATRVPSICWRGTLVFFREFVPVLSSWFKNHAHFLRYCLLKRSRWRYMSVC